MSTEEGWSGNVYLLAFVKDIEINAARRVHISNGKNEIYIYQMAK